MWMLALGGVFLATAQACVLCHLPDRDLAGRLAKLCSRVETRWKDCRASWSFPAFALDETSMNNVIEKTHRVLRVMEIKGSLSSLPLYRHWLQNTKLPAYSREALCAPACRGSTVVYNCSTCQELDVCCWPRKRCLPGSTPPPGLPWLRSSYLEEKRTSEGFHSLPASSSKDHEPTTSTSLQGDQPAPEFHSQRFSLPDPETQMSP
ncbi:sperm-egg fusion protein TMEM95 isoform X3 [Mustela putorius furo]|uniref:Sperm-egg fusion protein TMEM95 isoform X3 n=1 Tax=Mustela putorius furo TaxID=9669 RepID=A0A8U0TFP1_MUSPF|nr:sperm-egg fusion protein TMEM95 isoform X3 [Mustela putorius furo]